MIIQKYYKSYTAHRNQDLVGSRCERIHGHFYQYYISFRVERDPNNTAISTLFEDFDCIVEPLIKKCLDHSFLIDKNDPLYSTLKLHEQQFSKDLGLCVLDRPTSVENVAYCLFDALIRIFPNICEVKIQETASSIVAYTLDDYKKDCLESGKINSETTLSRYVDYILDTAK